MKAKVDEKTKALYVRCTPDEHARVVLKAEQLGMSLTELMIRAMHQYQGTDTLLGRLVALESRVAKLEGEA